ncbi:methyltransferase domain-containing protein [Amycolatopsis rubida]|uniref:Methyltransferase domain-containing protein n=1 Tax=Amycolatopsis rubida TaxID=112413 RepID=A0ABX0BRE9_9PSEU|nr:MULTISPECIES: class I SAM-dependent methyltransferase [Amycolatopsis]MYW90428.1 methyltransferase domain-containing protein [Amycolatopsis rubida]NEC55405.1 methyltransferase domain-containing protein [Amycolatopsis rubida]OAP22871.1 Ubiquinone biosynthesis O-methyltransferase [Amycolatopsis sp. M39]
MNSGEAAFAGRLFAAGIAAAELLTIGLGLRLGLYAHLCGRPLTAGELAGRAGIGPRYAREWLEQQAAAGIVTVSGEPPEHRFLLPDAHRAALTGDPPPALASVLPAAGIAPVLPRIAEAYRRDGGLGYHEYGEDFRGAQTELNRAVFEGELAGWIRSALPEVHRRLVRGAGIADVGCGSGWSSIALARAYPRAAVTGFDSDEAAVGEAKANAAAAGAPDTLAFARAAADGPAEAPGGGYALVCVLDALHDMARPVEVLRWCRRAVHASGGVLLMEPKAAEEFAAPAGEVERFLYAVSVLHCLPVGLSERPSAGTGTVIRPSVVRGYAHAAGFQSVAVLSVEHPLHRLYWLR